jgi:hypothetical protein
MTDDGRDGYLPSPHKQSVLRRWLSRKMVASIAILALVGSAVLGIGWAGAEDRARSATARIASLEAKLAQAQQRLERGQQRLERTEQRLENAVKREKAALLRGSNAFDCLNEVVARSFDVTFAEDAPRLIRDALRSPSCRALGYHHAD